MSEPEPRDRPARPAIAGLILAAGASTRLGEPKAAAVAHGKTFAAHVAHALQAGGVGSILAAIGAHEKTTRAAFEEITGVVCLRVLHPEEGAIASVRQGLEDLSRSAQLRGVIVAPVDHPAIRASTIVALCRAASSSSRPILVPSYAAKRGHPTYFAREIWSELAAPDLRQGARSVVRRDPDRVLEVAVSDPGVLLNIDTPESLARWRKTPIAIAERSP
ncbi:MAG: nucleotidyltransferase family protein [Candidatus Binatia bacterium]|nr:nucleotidyltransferase family protein [Candidatus Binatia bacterium]MDG2011611.1 nucleotidyltransferase family protein [Candidatus Binatia bacterium]HAC80836.1 hypothetical protein [Deltaproteobacteria bacterium]